MHYKQECLDIWNLFESTLKDLDLHNTDNHTAKRIQFYFILIQAAKRKIIDDQ